MSRDQLLGRARRAVLAVAETAGGLGGRTKRRQADDSPPTGRPVTHGLPPRIEREREPGLPPVQPEHRPTPGLPPRIERDHPAAGLPPRIERSAEPSLPPRIEREPVVQAEAEPEPEPQPELPPRIEPDPEPAEPAQEAPAERAPGPAAAAVGDSPEPAYRPIHARTEQPVLEPEPQNEPRPASIAPVRPDPLASPVRNVVREHQRLAYIVAAVIVVAAAGYWMLRVHQRIGEHALEAGITRQQHAPTVACSSLQPNGAAWACAVVFKAESVCLIARVNVLGSWSTAVGQHRCEKVPQLEKLLPQGITATMVAADINRRQGRSDFVCNKLPSHKVRWACERPLTTGGQCLVVRVIQWTSWNVLDGGKQCAKDPDLQNALKHSSA